MRSACLLLVCVLLPLDARGQAPGTTFRSSVDVVALSVVVTDADQKLVTGLAVDDFAVYEDGVRQEVSFFAASAIPLDLAILLDTSASMTDKIGTAQQAAIGFAETLRPGDRLIVVDIKDATKVLVPLAEDLDKARDAILSTTPRGGTALYNGLYVTLKELVKERRNNGEVRRQAIAVLSDGDDTASLVEFEDVMDVARQAGISIYTITLKSPYALRSAAQRGSRYFSRSEFSMKALAQETGARAFFPTHIAELSGVYTSIAVELASQYAIGYSSKNPKRDGAFRRVVVRVENRPFQTRTRNGYSSAPPPRATSTH